MRYTRRVIKFIAFVLTMVIFAVNIPQVVHADWKTYKKELEHVKNTMEDDGIVLTDLKGNTWYDWQVAMLFDGIGSYTYFHNLVEKKIRSENDGVAQSELVIQGAGRYGKNGRADIYKKEDDITYLWEVKPASHGKFPYKILDIDQINRYANAVPTYEVGPNNVIKMVQLL